MATTGFLTGDTKTVKVWSEIIYRDIKKSLFFTGMMGKGANNIIELKDDLLKSKGDKITFNLRMRSTSAGQSSSTTGVTLEGNEEALVFYSDSVSLTEYGNSAKVDGELSEQRVAFDIRSEIKDFLQDWGTEKVEKTILSNLASSPSTNRFIDSSADIMTVVDVEALRRQAILATPQIRPVKIKGRDYFVLLAHPYALKGLKADDNFKNYNKDARERGIDNPLIQGADFIIDGVLIYEYNRSELLQSGTVVRSLLLGAQAGVVAWSKKPSWHEKMFDYATKYGAAVKMILGVKKTVFNSEDYGCIAIDNLYTADA